MDGKRDKELITIDLRDKTARRSRLFKSVNETIEGVAKGERDWKEPVFTFRVPVDVYCYIVGLLGGSLSNMKDVEQVQNFFVMFGEWDDYQAAQRRFEENREDIQLIMASARLLKKMDGEKDD